MATAQRGVNFRELFRTRDMITEYCNDERRSLFFCAGLIYRFNAQLKKYEIIVIDYRRDGNGPLQIKFPGGSSTLEERPYDTLKRVLRIEAGYHLWGTAQVIYNWQIFKKQTTILEHVKLFFEKEVPYTPQKDFILDAMIGTGPDQEYSNVRWVVISKELLQQVFPTHKPGLEKLMKRLNIE